MQSIRSLDCYLAFETKNKMRIKLEWDFFFFLQYSHTAYDMNLVPAQFINRKLQSSKEAESDDQRGKARLTSAKLCQFIPTEHLLF